MEESAAVHPKFKLRDRLILAILIGLLTGIISIYVSTLSGGDAGDFRYCLWPARDWLAGKSPYLPFQQNLDPFAVPYPFTAILLATPLAWLPDRVAAGIFLGLGSSLLAWFILKKGDNWRLLLILSWPFVNNLLFVQWAPLIVSMFFTSAFPAFVLIKPQLALPFALTQKPDRMGLLFAGIFLLISLAIYPIWIADWLSTLHNFIGYPVLFYLPLGPLLFIALIRYRDRRVWLLLLLAAMPQRMVYDQLGVLLVAENRRQQLFLVICSWLSLPVVLIYHGWDNIPLGWRNWVLIESYLPALLVLLLPSINQLRSRISSHTFFVKPHPS